MGQSRLTPNTVAERLPQAGSRRADRIVVRCGEEVVAEHPRYFGRNRTICDPWHYLPVLARKPGALRNGAPFQDWDLPPALGRGLQTSILRVEVVEVSFKSKLSDKGRHGRRIIWKTGDPVGKTTYKLLNVSAWDIVAIDPNDYILASCFRKSLRQLPVECGFKASKHSILQISQVFLDVARPRPFH